MESYTPFRVRCKKILMSILPSSLFLLIQNIWIKTFARFFKVQDIVEIYTKKFLDTNTKVVQGGPFIGMNYVDHAVGSNYLHKLIGSYESVLHPIINSFSPHQFKTIIDIGCAEGYYLVGLGRMFPLATLVGFETEVEGQNLVKDLYHKNKLANKLVLQGKATAENVAPFVTANTLLICDCEGAELDILDPKKSPALKNVDLAIIELHDFLRPGIKESLTERFNSTHQIELVSFVMANPNQFQFLSNIVDQKHLYEIRRERGWQEQEWMILRKN